MAYQTLNNSGCSELLAWLLTANIDIFVIVLMKTPGLGLSAVYKKVQM